MKRLSFAILALVVLAPVAHAEELSAENLDQRRVQLRRLLEEQWEATLRRAPEFASILGDRRYNDQVSDVSAAAVRAELKESAAFLRRFEAIDPTAFSNHEQLNRDLMIRDLKTSLEGARFEDWKMPVNQMGGLHLQAAQLPSVLPFATTKDYDDYLARLRKLPRLFRDTTDNMRAGMKSGLLPPKFLLEAVAEQADGIADAKGEASPFAIPLSRFPESVPQAARERIRAAVLAAIDHEVIPSYRSFATFVREQYAPAGRTDVGVWSLPDGAARYAFNARTSTTTDLTPDEIHEIGLREVARIELEMLQIARSLRFEDLRALNAAIDANPELKAQSGEHLIELYRKYIDQMYGKLPLLFGRLPRASLEVVPVPAFREKAAAAASYETGSPDGSRPGRVYVNTWEAASRKLLPTESTAYHEGVPGHHMQLSIQQELVDLPPFRQQGGHTAFIEGWALYSERLGKDVGFYQDPYSDYGRLNDEMLRAIRLVVDTGLHHKRWTREQVVQFFRDHSAIDEVEIQAETDRYIVWPGQALAYKIGQLKILELRERAQKELGGRFDIRAFHDAVLGAGGLPLDALEARIERWMTEFRR